MDEFESKFIKGKSGKFWKPVDVGDKMFGKIIRTGQSKLGGVYYILQTSDGEEVSLPSHAAIKKKFDDYKIGIGDTVLVKYDGLSDKTYFGKHINLYSISAQHADGTWAGSDDSEEPSKPEPPKPEAPKSEAPKVEPPKVEVEKKKKKVPKEEPKPAEPTSDAVEDKNKEVKHFVGQLMKFFGEISMADLEKYVKEDRNFGMSVDSVIALCELDIIEKDGKKFVRKVT
jgi:hypothetical protein